MSSLTKNEIITLRHLADGQQHNEAPSTLSEAQYYVALKSLKSRDMVFAAFCEGEEVEAAQIKKSGQAVLEDLKSAEKRILRQILADKGLNQNQYDLLKYTQIHGISYTSEQFSQQFLQVDKNYFKEYVWKKLYDEGYLHTNEKRTGMILRPKGTQVIEEIEDELYSQLANDYWEEQIQRTTSEDDNPNKKSAIKDSGFRISEDRITDVIKTVWSMHDVGLFIDSNGNKPTVKSVMEAFAEFLQAKQLEQYSSYMNKALRSTKSTYLDVFYKMEKSAEKHYDEKKVREIGK